MTPARAAMRIDDLVAPNLAGVCDARTGDPVDAETIAAVIVDAAHVQALAEDGRRRMADAIGGAR